MHRNAVLSALCVVALALPATIAVGASATESSHGVRDMGRGGDHKRYSTSLDTASSAIPTTAKPSVDDRAVTTIRTRVAGAKGVASSIATSDCDGCTAQSTVFQVIYIDGRGGAAADNVASAWSSCVGCASSAVSVQLVVSRRVQPLVVNNRSLAVNADCVECSTSAAAIQFVLAGGSGRTLSTQARELITQIQAELADRLAPPAGAERRVAPVDPRTAAEETAKKLEQVVLKDLRVSKLQRNVDVSVAG